MTTINLTLLECDGIHGAKIRSKHFPAFALEISGWTKCYDEHLCPACSVLHMLVFVAHVVKGEPDCGSAMKHGYHTTFAYNIMPYDITMTELAESHPDVWSDR